MNNESWENEKRVLEETIKLLKEANYILQTANDEWNKKEAYEDYKFTYGKIKNITFKDFKENYFYDMEKCSMCGDWLIRDDMFDTEEMVNGGIGYVCEGCRDNM